MSEAVDVIVVGSGAGGGTLAYALATSGVRVVVLEKGPHYTLDDFQAHDEIRVSRRDFFVPYATEEPHLVRVGGKGPFTKSREGWIACCVGGGTVHMGGFFYRLHPVDIVQATKLGVPEGSTVADWPLGYEELAPYYEQIEALLGISGENSGNPFEAPRGPYPLPPVREHPLTAPLTRAARSIGLHPFVTPRAVLSMPHEGRPACNYCGYCASYGCENGAKSSVLAALLPRAVKTGNCRIVAQAMATEVLAGADGKAQGVRYLDAKGAMHELRARVVVVSCSSIESARLLLNSRSMRFPNGLANGSGLVGKNLTFSAFADVEAELLAEGAGKKHAGLFDRSPWIGRSVQDLYRPPPASGVRKGGTIRFDLLHPNPIFQAERAATEGRGVLFGAALKERLRQKFRGGRTLEAEIFAEFLPTPHTFVETDPEVKDRYGLPVAKIAVQHHPDDARATQLLARKASEVFEALGADRIATRTTLGVSWVLQHGTCRFGTDPSRSVLDRNCRAHDVPNLYVVDGSFLPTSGGVPTTLTIQANALRVAAQLRSRLLAREL